MKDIKSAVFMLLLLTCICGGLYPIAVTGLAQLLFPQQANGSLMTDANGRVIGSALIGQPFSDARYLWPRPSATAVFAYNPMASGGSNISPAALGYRKTIDERLGRLHAAGINGPIATDLLQASGSGLDPHISPLAADLQIQRIAQARHMPKEKVAAIIAAHQEDRQFGLFGAPRVHVLAVNLALDAASP